MSFAAKWIDLQITILREINQREKDKYHMISLCGIFKKNYTNELIYKTETAASHSLKPSSHVLCTLGCDLVFRRLCLPGGALLLPGAQEWG